MIRTGYIQDLKVIGRTPDHLDLGDMDDVVQLPLNELSGKNEEVTSLNVFVFRDDKGKRWATTQLPKVHVGQFSTLRVRAVDEDGAFLEWSAECDLFVPRQEQRKPLVVGRWYVVRVALDERTDTPYGSTRIEDHLDNEELSVAQGEAVDLVVFAKSPLGFSVTVNDLHLGLVHNSEVYRPISIGDRVKGYIKIIRDDHKLDITLQAIGYRQYNDVNTALVATRIQSRGGFLPLSDASSPEEIHAEFGISKKAFKKAVGALYKDRSIRIEDQGIIWVG